MTLGNFLQFIEIRTKLASFIPLMLGTLYSIYRYKNFNFKNFIIMFISVLTFDMATTAINNYLDCKKTNKINGCTAVKEQISDAAGLMIIFALLAAATVSGIWLTLNTDLVVLLIGIVSFMIGIIYTFGPVPISHTPFGELFSGFFMGFIIIFLSIYIHDNNIVFLIYNNHILSIDMNITEIFYIFLISVPAICCIANIMLANNICDMNEDIINKRYTLPQYIGRENALKLFQLLYFAAYADIIILVILKIAPVVLLLVLITIIPVNGNIKLFSKNTVKSETFVTAVKNFVFINLSQVILLGLAVVIRYL